MLRAGHSDDRSSSINDRGRPLRISLSSLAVVMIWGSLLWMMVGPPLQLPFLPAEIRVYDLSAGLGILLGAALLAKAVFSSVPLRTPIFAFFLAYVGAVLFFPLLGLMFVHQAQLSMYFGDLRWLLIIAMVVIAASIYSTQRKGLLERDVVKVWFIAVVATWAVLVPQIILQVGGGSTPWIVDFWYPEGQFGPRNGFHIFRFAGPFGTISGLATFGLTGFIAGVLTSTQWRLSLFLTLSGLFFVLASGSRTAMVIAGAFVLCYLMRPRIRFSFSATTAFRVAGLFAGLAGSYWVATYFGVGRMVSGDGRLASILAWLRGDVSLFEIAGRGGDRWSLPIIESQSWSPLGTLVNSSHALDHLPAFDSYYVLLWAQAGPFIAIPFLLLISTAFFFSVRNYQQKKNFVTSLAIAVVVILPVYGLTQNSMSGLLGRSLLAIAVIVTLVETIKNRINITQVKII